MNTQENLKRLGTVMLIASTLTFGTGCESVPAVPAITPRPTPTEVITPKSPEYASWSNLSALTRIQRLEIQTYPRIEGFSPQYELRKATAEHVAQQVNSQVKTEDLIKKVDIVDQSILIGNIEQDLGRKLSEIEQKKHLLIESHYKNRQGVVLVNEATIQNAEQRARSMPEGMRELANRNLKVVLEENAFVRAYVDVLSPKDEEAIDVFVPRQPSSIKITKRKGLIFYGEQGGVSVVLDGAEKANVENIARQITPSSIPFTSASYRAGADNITTVNQRTGIRKDEQLRAYGKNDYVPYITQRWASVLLPGNPDPKLAIAQFVSIAAFVEDLTVREMVSLTNPISKKP